MLRYFNTPQDCEHIIIPCSNCNQEFSRQIYVLQFKRLPQMSFFYVGKTRRIRRCIRTYLEEVPYVLHLLLIHQVYLVLLVIHLVVMNNLYTQFLHNIHCHQFHRHIVLQSQMSFFYVGKTADLQAKWLNH